MNEMQTLTNIERRINYHMQSAYTNILEVGRCLIEAKESGLVPHGQWEAWVNRVANMNERTAQRLMQAAREVSPDSAMAKLPISKIQAILALPEPQREAVAVKAVEENQSLRELQATIDAMRGDLEDARKKAQRAECERDNAIKVLDKAQKRRAEFEHECNELRRQMQGIKAAPPTGISAEAQRQIDNFRGQARNAERRAEELAAQLADAEQMAEYQAQQRQQAQQELLDLRTQAARGEGAVCDDTTVDSIVTAVRAFVGSAGYLPHFAQLGKLSEAERQRVTAHVDMIAEWVGAIREALATPDVIVIEEV